MEKNTFAFIIHPIEAQDVARKFSFAKGLPPSILEKAANLLPPLKASHITGVRSATGATTEGWFVACPLTSRLMMTLPEDYVIGKIIKSVHLAEKLGAKIVGLGAFTSVVGDAGITVARHANIAVTSGNSYTVATALEGIERAAGIMGVAMDRAEVVVVGATGSIGSACARILARKVKYLTLVGRNQPKLERLAEHILHETGLSTPITTDVRAALRRADIVVTVTSALDTVIYPEDLKPGAIVCDVARPRDVSRQVAELRDDVLVFEGGVVEVPGEVDFHFNFGFPPKTSYACMAETMILALEGRFENFSLGRDLTVEQIEEISALAKKHGFRLAGLRSFERALTDAEIAVIRDNARKKKGLPPLDSTQPLAAPHPA